MRAAVGQTGFCALRFLCSCVCDCVYDVDRESAIKLGTDMYVYIITECYFEAW